MKKKIKTVLIIILFAIALYPIISYFFIHKTVEGEIVELEEDKIVVKTGEKERTFKYDEQETIIEYCRNDTKDCFEPFDIYDSYSFSNDYHYQDFKESEITIKTFRGKLTEIKITYNREKILKNKEKKYESEHIFFKEIQKEVTSNKERKYQLTAKLHVPSNKKQYVVAYSDKRKELKQEEKEIGLNFDDKEYLVKYSFEVYVQLEDGRYQRDTDNLIVNKDYLKGQKIIEPKKETTFTFQTEDELLNFADIFDQFEHEIN